MQEMTHENAFKEAYQALNAEQKKAVDAIEGSVLVVAGPGTGKTQILTLRIANILLKTDTMPEQILALTFTESGAKAMRERLRLYVGALAYRVNIHTFHGFADRLIREYPGAYTQVVGGRAATELQKIGIIEDVLEDKNIKELRPIGNPTFYVSHILRAISDMKREYIRVDDFAAIIADQEKQLATTERVHEKGAHKGKVRGEYQKLEKSIVRNKELLHIYRQYEAVLQEERLYDYEDMILETITALEANEDMLRGLQETYQYVLADEHQDVNAAQNQMLSLLCSYHKNPNLFVVGDEKQAIYRFQGASLENFLYFENAYPETTTIELTQNYRSKQPILDAAHSLITTEAGPAKDLRVPLMAEDNDGALSELRQFGHQGVEDAWVVDAIAASIDEGHAPEDIAVIVRTNREVESFAALLRKQGISVRASADSDILAHPITHSVRGIIGAVHGDENALFRVLQRAYWQIPIDDVMKICAHRSSERSLSSIVADKKILTEIGVQNTEAALKVHTVLKEAHKREVSEAPHRVLEFLLSESGFLDHVLKSEPLEGGRIVRRIYDEVEAMVLEGNTSSLQDVTSFFDAQETYGVALSAPYITTTTHAVEVMTAHKAKGLEFESVYVPHLTDGVWGGRKKAEYFKIPLTKHIEDGVFDALDDERRLLYVAMTRAKKSLFLSHAETNADGRAYVPSRLLSEIDPSLIAEAETEDYDTEFDPAASLLPVRQTTFDTSILKAMFVERGLSVTALNNYLRSPWDYFYRNVLRIPEVQTLPMQFGTALHGVMERVARAISDGEKKPTPSVLAKWLHGELSKLPLATSEHAQLHEKGLLALTAYAEVTVFPEKSLQEFRLRVMLPTGEKDIPEVPLTGVIDRLDLDEEGSALRFVDYKSGKPKTRGEIEGTTKNSHGDYKRQLVFYALLLSLYDDERYQCREGVLSFIEPDSKGVVHEEMYEITEEEIAELKEEIIRVAKEIVSGSFLQHACNPEESEYCDFVEQFNNLTNTE